MNVKREKTDCRTMRCGCMYPNKMEKSLRGGEGVERIDVEVNIGSRSFVAENQMLICLMQMLMQGKKR